MRPLAEYAMRSRRNASAAVLLIGFIPFVSWLSASLLALVVLRKGAYEGALVALWGLLPAIYFWQAGYDAVALPSLFVVFLSALVLRRTVSLERSVLTQLLVSVLFVALLLEFRFLPYEQLLDVSKQLLTKLELSKQVKMPVLGAQDYERLVTNFLGFSLGSMALTALIVARWWQAMLYNPGGFQKEFHQFRLSPLAATAITAALLLTGSESWLANILLLLVLPLFMSALALVHGSVKLLGASRRSLIVFYAALLMLGPYVFIPLLILAVADSFFDFRNRFKKIARNGN